MEKEDMIEQIKNIHSDLKNVPLCDYHSMTTKDLRRKYNILKSLQEKTTILDRLREYGDPISNVNMHLVTLRNNINFLELNGSKYNADIRKHLVLQFIKSKILDPDGFSRGSTYIGNVNYRVLMTDSIETLQNKINLLVSQNTRKKLIKNLIILGYKKSYLRNLNNSSLEKLLEKPNPYIKSNRKELIEVLSDYDWSPKTIKSWNTKKMNEAFKKDLSKKFSPLAECPNKKGVVIHPRRNRSTIEYLKGLSNALFYEITT